jgi:hypothetical protein
LENHTVILRAKANAPSDDSTIEQIDTDRCDPSDWSPAAIGLDQLVR